MSASETSSRSGGRPLSPHAQLGSTRVADVKWQAGFWKRWWDTCRDAMIPAMWEILNDDELSHAFANLHIAAGDRDGDHKGPPFWDGDIYKWLEGAVAIYANEPSTDLRELIDNVVDVISRTQRADGYIHSQVVIEERNRGDHSGELRDHLNFEMYNMGHLMTVACLHRDVTGDSTLFDTAVRACDYLEHTFANPTADHARHSVCPSHFMGLAQMYRSTGEKRYLELFKTLFNMRDLREGGEDQNQDRIPFRDQRHAIGHSVRANYLYAGAADLFAETGEQALMDALEPIWENLVTQKMYITGACGAIYDGASPDGSKDHDGIQLIHQAYGREYELPNVTAYNETCANIGNVLWNWRMLLATGDSKYADIVELALINSVLCGVSLDGKQYFYTNALERANDLPFTLRWSARRESFISSFCCPPNTVRTVAQSAQYAYALSDREISTVVYGASDAELDVPGAGRVRIEQRTGYPFDGSISLVLASAPKKEITVNLRIPAWANRASVTVNGKPVDVGASPGTYCELTRSWKAGDKIGIELPMEPRIMEAHPLVEEDRNMVAVTRGPVVYCLESADMPEGVSVNDVHISSDTEFRPIDGTGIFSEMKVLEFTARVRRGADWSSALYRPVERGAFDEVDTQLIPYCAWDNRSDGEMTVWLRFAR